MCPKGDDPYTTNQNYRKFRLTVSVPIPLAVVEGTLGITFMGKKTFMDIQRFRASSAKCTAAFSVFGSAACVFRRVRAEIFQFDIEFYSFPQYPQLNNLFIHDGNPSIYDFFCDVSQSFPFLSCNFRDITSTNIKGKTNRRFSKLALIVAYLEYAFCSNRGLCDFTNGVCHCSPGLGGPACSNVTYLYAQESTSLPGLDVTVRGLDYSSNALQINAIRGKSAEYNLIEAVAGTEKMFYVSGDGTVGLNRLRTLSGGQTIAGGGLYIQSGGATIVDDGLNAYSTSTTSPVVKIASTSSVSLTSAYTVLSVSSQSSSLANYNLFAASSAGTTRFLVRADGAVFVNTGGIAVTNGATIGSGGLTVTGGVTVHSNGLRVRSGGVELTGGLSIQSGGVDIIRGGMEVYAGGVSIYSGGMRLSGGLTILSSGFRVTNGVTINSGGIRLTGGVSILSAGLRVTEGGIRILNKGLQVASGGLTVTEGGLMVSSGSITIQNGGIIVTNNGLSIQSGGLVTTGGLTVFNGGVVVRSGITVESVGIAVSGGASIRAGGLAVTGGVTVRSNGLAVLSGLSVLSGGMVVNNALSVTGGASIESGGLNVLFGGLTVQGNSHFENDLVVANDLQIGGGLLISSGLTVFGGVRFQNTPTVFSDRQLKRNLVPIDGALGKVSKLRGVYFNWRQTEESGLDFDNDRHVGVLAQDIFDVLPEAVYGKHNNRYLGVDYQALIPLLVEAIKDLDTIIEKEIARVPQSSYVNSMADVPVDSKNSPCNSLKEELLIMKRDIAEARVINSQLRLEVNDLVKEIVSINTTHESSTEMVKEEKILHSDVPKDRSRLMNTGIRLFGSKLINLFRPSQRMIS